MIFIDVGTHEGHTLEEVTKDHYSWDVIYGFEPMPLQYMAASHRFPQVLIHNAGLSDRSGWIEVHGENTGPEASPYPDKVDVDQDHSTLCRMIRASEFFADLPAGLVVELNCDGAEAPILQDLCDSGQIHKCHAIMIDCDARRVPLTAQRPDQILTRMAEVGFDRYQLCGDVMIGGTHQDRIANWLRGVL
jgi:FkbM family methyltransferase